MIFIAGLATIILGWTFQIYRTSVRKEHGLSLAFLVLYALGCVLLASGSFLKADIASGILNIGCVVVASIVVAGTAINNKAR